MTDQRNLFGDAEPRRPESPEDRPQGPEVSSGGSGRARAKESQRDALRALREDGKAESDRAAYARLLWSAAQAGVEIEQAPKPLEALTDKEAAYVLGKKKNAINARRNELMGSLDKYEEVPVVVEHGRRRSHVGDEGISNTTYAFNPRLIDAFRDAQNQTENR